MRTTTRSRVSLDFTCVFMPVWPDGFNGLGVEEAPHHVGCPIVRRMNGDGVELAVSDEGDGPAGAAAARLPGLARPVAPPDPGAQRGRVCGPSRPTCAASASRTSPRTSSDYRVGRSVADMVAMLDALGDRAGARRRPRLGRRRGVGDGADGARARRAARRAVRRPPGDVRAAARSPSARSRGTCCCSSSRRPRSSCARDDWALMREWMASHPELDAAIERLAQPGALTAALNWYRANMHPRNELAPAPQLPNVQASTRSGSGAAATRYLLEDGMTALRRARRRHVALRAHRGRGPLDAARRARARERAAGRVPVLNAVELRAAFAARELSPVEIDRRRRRARGARRVHHAHARCGARAGARGRARLRARRGAPAGRADARGQGPLRHRRRAHDLRLEDLRRPRARTPTRRWCGARRRRARSSSARRSRTSSRGASRASTRTSRRAATRTTPSACRAARAAARRSRSPPARRRSRSAPTPAARSGSRPRSAASPGLKPTYGRLSTDGRLPARAVARPRRPDGAHARRRAAASTRRSPGRASGDPRRGSRSARTCTCARSSRASSARSTPPSRRSTPIEVGFDAPEHLYPTYATIQNAEAAQTHAELFPARRDEYGDDVAGRLDAAREGDARRVRRGDDRARAHPRRVPARCSRDCRPAAHADLRRPAGADRAADPPGASATACCPTPSRRTSPACRPAPCRSASTTTACRSASSSPARRAARAACSPPPRRCTPLQHRRGRDPRPPRDLRDQHPDVVLEAPAPVLARLQRADDRMLAARGVRASRDGSASRRSSRRGRTRGRCAGAARRRRRAGSPRSRRPPPAAR